MRNGSCRSVLATARALQIVLNSDSSGADVDLDVGWAHKSAPRDVYEELIAKYPEIQTLFKVNWR